MTRGEAKRLREIIETAVQSLDDSTALESVTLFQAWEPGKSYSAGERVSYGGILYSVLQAHTSQDTWTPTAAPSLFAQVLIPDPDNPPEWIQPDSTNPYAAGDRVTHNGKLWESTVDNNVWEPGVYGWTEVTESEQKTE